MLRFLSITRVPKPEAFESVMVCPESPGAKVTVPPSGTAARASRSEQSAVSHTPSKVSALLLTTGLLTAATLFRLKLRLLAPDAAAVRL